MCEQTPILGIATDDDASLVCATVGTAIACYQFTANNPADEVLAPLSVAEVRTRACVRVRVCVCARVRKQARLRVRVREHYLLVAW